MRKLNLLLAIGCFLAIYACQKESINSLPESTTITTETTDESQYFKINTLEDLATFEELFVQNESAISRSNICGKIVHVPNNSKNALQAAIAEAGRYGLVVLAKGNHYEDETVVIDHPVYILGRKGAKVITNLGPTTNFVTIPLFSIRQTTRVTIWGVEMEGKESLSGTAVEILNSTHTVLAKNTITNFIGGCGVQEGDYSLFWKNEIVGRAGFSEGGIVVVNGKDIRIFHNKISGCIWNILCAGQNGIIQGNELFGSPNIGLDLSYINPILQTSAGNIIGATTPATNWWVQDNYSHDNGYTGYSVDSGANNNTLINNRGGNNAIADLVLDEEGPNALGFITPTSKDNFVDVRDNTDFTSVDCGENNRVRGGVQIPCQ